MYPIENYTFIRKPAYTKNVDGKAVEYGETIYAITHYRGKAVKAYARCRPGDVFDEDYGKRLAAARCNLKVLQKKRNDFKEEFDILYRVYENAQVKAYRAANKVMDVDDLIEEGKEFLETIESIH